MNVEVIVVAHDYAADIVKIVLQRTVREMKAENKLVSLWSVSLFLLISFLTCRGESIAQEFMLGGGLIRDQKNGAPKPNPRIKTDWSEEKKGLAIRLSGEAKSRWGLAEPPTFLLQVRNRSEEAQTLTLSEKDLSISVNGKNLVWNSTGTKLITSLKPGETKLGFFILRLDANQWKPEGAKSSTTNRLEVLDVGKKELVVKLRVGAGGDKNSDQAVELATGKIDFEITPAVFELPTVNGVILGQDGKPIEGADVYLCKDAQFSIYYSNYDGKWFKTKSVSHYDPFGGFSSQIKPVKTNAKGEFAFSPGMRDKRIVVLPPVGSAQIFDLPKNYSSWEVRLGKTGSLLIEHDLPGETSTVNASMSTSRVLAVTEKKNTYMFTESYSIPLSNGKKYELKNVQPNRFNFNRYKYVRVGNRSYSIGRMNRTFAVEAGKETAFRMVRKSGQKVKLTASKVPAKMQYVVASIFAMDESINTKTIYGNQTLWSDASAKGEKAIDFESVLIAPGQYRLVVMSVPPGKKPNQSTYKPDHIGSKIINVKQGGTLEAGEIRLLPVETWIRNSGMALDLKLIDKMGTASGARSIWPLSVGYKAGYDGKEFKSNGLGLASVLRPAGKYYFAVGLDQYQPTFFKVSVPRMTPQTVVMDDKPWWATDESKKLDLELSLEYVQESDKFVLTAENKGKDALRPKLGDIQIFVQTQAINRALGLRVLPPEQSEIYQREIKPQAKTKFEFGRRELLENGLCTSGRLNRVKLHESKFNLPAKSVLAAVMVAKSVSNPVIVPELPQLPPKPFR